MSFCHVIHSLFPFCWLAAESAWRQREEQQRSDGGLNHFSSHHNFIRRGETKLNKPQAKTASVQTAPPETVVTLGHCCKISDIPTYSVCRNCTQLLTFVLSFQIFISAERWRQLLLMLVKSFQKNVLIWADSALWMHALVSRCSQHFY